MSANCPTCNAQVCPTCQQVLTYYTGGTICWPCTGKELDEAERQPTWGYHDEVELWDGFNWQVTKLSHKYGVWYAGDWRTNFRHTGEWSKTGFFRRIVELTEVDS